MDFRGDRRGQAVQVGAVMLFATLVILMSLYQATVVPSENRRVEFNDYQDATGDVSALRNAMLSTAAGDGQSGVTVQTGSRYPARAVFVNPPPATGRIRTVEAANVTLWNVTAAGDAGNVDAYFGSENHRLDYSTQRLVFDPSYNEFQGAASVVVAGGLVYRDYDEPVPVTGQTLIRGNRLTLVTLAGNLSAGGYRTPVTVEALSAHTRTVTVESRDGDPFNVTIPTTLDAETWKETLLADQLDPPGSPDHPHRYVRNVRSASGNAVNVTLEGDATYELQVGRVAVREHGDSLDADAPEPRYVTRIGDRMAATGIDGRRKLTVEVRDRYNNPVSDANVTFNASVGAFESETGTVLNESDYNKTVVRTDEKGRATVWFNVSDSLGVHTAKAYLGNQVDDSLPAEKRTRFETLSTGGGGGSGGGGGGEGASFILLNDTDTTLRGVGLMTVRLNNTGSTALNLTGVQLAHVTNVKGDISDGPNELVRLTVGTETRQVNAEENLRAEFFRNDTVEFGPGLNDVQLEFDRKYDKQVMLRFHLYFEGGITAVFDLVIFG